MRILPIFLTLFLLTGCGLQNINNVVATPDLRLQLHEIETVERAGGSFRCGVDHGGLLPEDFYEGVADGSLVIGANSFFRSFSDNDHDRCKRGQANQIHGFASFDLSALEQHDPAVSRRVTTALLAMDVAPAFDAGDAGCGTSALGTLGEVLRWTPGLYLNDGSRIVQNPPERITIGPFGLDNRDMSFREFALMNETPFDETSPGGRSMLVGMNERAISDLQNLVTRRNSYSLRNYGLYFLSGMVGDPRTNQRCLKRYGNLRLTVFYRDE